MSDLEQPIVYYSTEKFVIYLAVLLGFMFDGYDLLLTSFVLGPMATYFNVSIATVAFALTLVLVSSVIGGIFFGWLADRIGRRPVLFITIITYGITTILAGAVTSIPMFYLLRFLTGLGVGGEWGIGFSLLSEAYSEKTRGKAGGFLASMYVFGSLLGAVTADYTLTTFGSSLGWRYAYIIAGVSALVLVLLRLAMPESKVWLRYKEYKKQGKLPPGYSQRSPILDIFSRKYIRYTLSGTLMAVAYLFFTYSYLSFIPTYFHSVYNIPVPVYTEMIVIAEVIGIIGYILNGFLSDTIGRKKTAVVYGVLSILSILWFWYEAVQAPAFTGIFSFPVFYAYSAVYFSAGFIAQFGVWIGEHFATRMRATGSNFSYMVGRGLGGGLPPILVPLWTGFGGLGIAMSIGMMAGAIVQFAAILGLKETKGTKITAV
ncbi:MAG: MFS transporter [Nitrososphaerota archaeon]|nr:MFS transporter [Nitrososphaerota archaeon]